MWYVIITRPRIIEFLFILCSARSGLAAVLMHDHLSVVGSEFFILICWRPWLEPGPEEGNGALETHVLPGKHPTEPQIVAPTGHDVILTS